MTRACCSLVSFLQVPEKRIGHTAYSRGSDESTPIAATVAYISERFNHELLIDRFKKEGTHLCCKMNFIVCNSLT